MSVALIAAAVLGGPAPVPAQDEIFVANLSAASVRSTRGSGPATSRPQPDHTAATG
ncbi:MAG TPA: hypothetical protein VEL75_05010 [Candidatus Methylomirabilis sp.]|nr:hypothetical protein [Candidatus Methylomirabilis sp.]